MSKRGEKLHREIMAAVASHRGITKAYGAAAPMREAVLSGVILNLAEALTDAHRQARRTDKQLRQQGRQMRKHARALAAIARPAIGPAPRTGMVPFRPAEWQVRLAPAAEPARNGFDHLGDHHG
jgi:hypothetical protein